MTADELLSGDHLPMPAAPERMTDEEVDAYHERIAIMLEAGDVRERVARALARGEIMQERRRTTVELVDAGGGRFF
jgi:tripartite-type tricarboxylate transporter receptor subunit TctC